jgi:proteasome assembly chaperone (PAC2) family protein
VTEQHVYFPRLEHPLQNPVLVCAFRGWNDAGHAASLLVESLMDWLDASRVAEIDPEIFYDFQVSRPEVVGVDEDRHIEWPTNEFHAAALPGTERDVVLLSGLEPNVRWRTFVESMLFAMNTLGIKQTVFLGALQVDVPHSRPTPVSARVSKHTALGRLALSTTSYEGPTGITGVLDHACRAADLDTSSLWAGVPHYLAGAEYPQGSIALADGLFKLLEISVPLDELTNQAATQLENLAELLAEDEDLAEYVSELERRADERQDLLQIQRDSEHVSGDTLAADFERYLRDRGEGH